MHSSRSRACVAASARLFGRTREQMTQDLSGPDNYMSAQQALEYGLVDKISTVVDGP